MKSVLYEYLRDRSRSITTSFGRAFGCKPHFHRSIEILYITDGEVECSVGDEKFLATPDDIIFVHNYYIHSFSSKAEHEKYFVIIPLDFGGDIQRLTDHATIGPHLSDKEFNRSMFPYIKAMYDEHEDMTRIIQKGFANIIAGKLFSHYDGRAVKTQENIMLMVDVLKYIDDHSKESISLESIAEHFGYNKYYFSRLFNRYIGENLSAYINVVRVQSFMRRAKREEELCISELAYECGFDSLPTFYRSFKSVYGTTPKEYFKGAGEGR